MTAPEMQTLIASLTGPLFAPIGDRIKRAGQIGWKWSWFTPEMHGHGYTREQMHAMANASALAACELQRIVEIQNAIAAGGVVL